MSGAPLSATPYSPRVPASESTVTPFHSSAPAQRGPAFTCLSWSDSTGMIRWGGPPRRYNMNHRFVLPVLTAGTFALTAFAQDKSGPEVLGRGPLHEAYAQPWQPNPAPNQAIGQKPPEPVPEEPPAEKPEGKNVQFIPGYWQFDTDKKDFVWISGFWREVPTGRRWVMGYWSDTAEGWRYVGGHWAD